MKIVQVSTNDIRGGAARAAYRLHQGLLQIGQDCRMLVRYKDSTDASVFSVTPTNSAEKPDEEIFLSTVIQGHYIDSHRTAISNTIFSLPYPGYDLSALPLVQAADLINMHWVAYYQSPLTLHKLFALGNPVVWTLHDQWAFTGGCHYVAGCEKYRRDCVACPQLADDPFDLPAAVLRDKLELFKGANLTIVTPSQWLAARVGESKLFKNLRVEVIPNSLDTDVFSPLPKAEAKESLGFSAEAVTLLFGVENSNEKRKGFRELMAAIKHCLAQSEFQNLVEDDKIRILCFGRPSDELEAVNIPVVSLGYLSLDEEIRTVYAAADIFVLPSLEDNLPNTMLESMSCGTPVVAFDVGGIPDVVLSGVTGQLVPVSDASQLGEAILSLVFNPDRREEIGQNCRKAMVEGYSLTVQARRYLELYRELLWECKLTAQIAPEDSATESDQTEVPVVALTAGTLPVYLETAVGTHFQDIYGQVLFKALKEFSSAREKAYQASEADRAARLDVIHQLSEELEASEADRVARLDVIHQLSEKLEASEADRVARLEVIQRQGVEIGQLQHQLQALQGQRAVRILKRLHLIKDVSPAPDGDQPDSCHAIREPKHLGGVSYNAVIINNIIIGLRSLGYEVERYEIDVADYWTYFEAAAYKEKYPDYYDFNLPEKSLEHYIAARLLDLNPNDVYIDIASEGSPVPEIYNRLFGCTTYRQDMAYPKGLNGNAIGGDAADMLIPDSFASKMALHCSFEHFEGDSDIGFIKEASRVLRKGGAVCIVPLYLYDKYAILTDPNISVPEKVRFEDDAIVYCDPNWENRHGRLYDPVHLIQRVHNNLNGMTMKIYKITNAKEVDQSCYVEFAALITKP
jgi:glycosyltransferase involved in cell wall biosynthesis